MFALGLPGFCTFLYMVRVFQAMQDTRTAFRLYVVENGINIVFGVPLVGPLGVRGLALSLSIAYTAGGRAGHRRWSASGSAVSAATTSPPRSNGCSAASAVMAVATVVALNVSGASVGLRAAGPGGLRRGGRRAVAYGATAALLAARAEQAAAAARTRRQPDRAGRPDAARARVRAGAGRTRGRSGPSAAGRPDVPWQTRRSRPAAALPPPAAGEQRAGRGDHPPADEEDIDGPDPGGNR